MVVYLFWDDTDLTTFHTRDAPRHPAEQGLEVVGQHLGHGGLDGHAQGVHLPRKGEAGLP